MSFSLNLKFGHLLLENSSHTSVQISFKESDIQETSLQIRNIKTTINSPNLIIKIPQCLHQILSSNTYLQKKLEKLKLVVTKEVLNDDCLIIGTYNEQTNKFINKLQHVFKPIAKLNNYVTIKVDSQIGKQQNQIFNKYSLFQNSIININGQLDKSSIQTLENSLKNVSPAFINSPLMAIVQLFINFNCDIELESFDQLPQQLKTVITKDNKHPSAQESQFYSKISASKQNIQILFTVPQLLSINGSISPQSLVTFIQY